MWNEGAARVYGWSAEEAIGQYVPSFVRMDLSEERRAEIRREIAEHGRVRFEATVERRDGSIVSVEVINVAIRDVRGEITGYLGIHRDITERKEAEEALQEANRRSRMILESITDTFGAVDVDWRYTYLNQRALELYREAQGVDVALEDLLGRSMWDLFPELVGTTVEREVRRAVREQTPVVFETYSRATARWVEGRAYPTEDGGLLTFGRDIAERKRVEEQLVYHAQLLENMDDAVLATDERFVLRAWNRGAERMFGWTADEAVGRLVYELIPTSFSDDELAAEMASLVEAGRWRGEATWYGKHGEAVYAEANNIALRSDEGSVTGYLCIMRDVGERHQARNELEMRARQQALLADLTLRNVTNGELHAVLDDAVALVARTLEVELSSIAQILPGDREISWCAAYGWSEGDLARAGPSPATAESLVGYAFRAGGPVISEDVRADERFGISGLFARQRPVSVVALAIPVEKKRFGVLVAASRERRSFAREDVDFMRAVANIIGIAVERSRVVERLEEVRESERSRIARDLHDDALTALADAVAQASMARSASISEHDREQWSSQMAMLQRAGRQLRSSIYDLRLGAEEHRPFSELVSELVAHHAEMSADCEVRLKGQAALPNRPLGNHGTEVLHIVGEAITNARRHSGASTITIDATQSDTRTLRLKVTDDGSWADPHPAGMRGRGTGINGMTERADLLGADLAIESRPEGGTVVSIELEFAVPK
jgi:PAS domain S-box-containing protein